MSAAARCNNLDPMAPLTVSLGKVLAKFTMLNLQPQHNHHPNNFGTKLSDEDRRRRRHTLGQNSSLRTRHHPMHSFSVNPSTTTRRPVAQARRVFGTLSAILLIACVLVGLTPEAHARAFNVTEVAASIANERLELEFDLDLSLSDEAIDALNHGIALYIIVEVELREKRRLKRDSLVERSRKDVEISYHGLSGRYLIQESGIGTVSTHLTVEDALRAISSNRQVLIPVPELPTNQSIDYLIAVRTRLNNETLPNPLRFISKLLPSWRLDSGWTIWPVRY